MLLLIKKQTDTLIGQTKTKPQKTLEIKRNKQMETFSFNTAMNLFGEGKWLLAVASFEAIKSIFDINDDNNIFSIGIPRYWRITNYLPDANNDRLKELSELPSQNDIDLIVKEVEKSKTQIEIENSVYNSAAFAHSKKNYLQEYAK